jgi:hypothetical protein
MFCPSAESLCIYKGKMYAKTTVGEEFRDSKWMIKARVLDADYHWSDDNVSWTLYRVAVVQTFKGHPPNNITVFTFRDSGGFYLDKGSDPDLGGEYLLFLEPIRIDSNVPKQAYQATEVNYSCGQSKLWGEVSPSEKQELSKLTRLQ